MELNTSKISSKEIIKNFTMYEKIATCNKKNQDVHLFINIAKSTFICNDWLRLVLRVWGNDERNEMRSLQIHGKLSRAIWTMCSELPSKRRERILRCASKNLLLQNKIIAIIPEFQEVLDKEYQYKLTYQGHRYNPYEYGQQYGSWFFESVCNSKKFHLEVLNIFDKKNNYDRFTCS